MNKFSLFISLVLLSLAAGCGGFYGPMGYGPMGRWGHMMDYGYGYGFGGMFMGILFLIIIGVAIYFVFQNIKSRSGGFGGESALDILKKRYAKGEITKEEFDKMKDDLK